MSNNIDINDLNSKKEFNDSNSNRQVKRLKTIDDNNVIYVKREKKSFPQLWISFGLYKAKRFYSYENYLYKVCYDMVYRPSLANLIVNTTEKNLNMTRNLLAFNEEKYGIKPIDNNDREDLLEENLYVKRTFMYNTYDLYISVSYPTVILMLTFLKLKLQSHNKLLFYMLITFVGINTVSSLWVNNKKRDLETGFTTKELKEKYSNVIQKYKFIYEDEI